MSTFVGISLDFAILRGYNS